MLFSQGEYWRPTGKTGDKASVACLVYRQMNLDDFVGIGRWKYENVFSFLKYEI